MSNLKQLHELSQGSFSGAAEVPAVPERVEHTFRELGSDGFGWLAKDLSETKDIELIVNYH